MIDVHVRLTADVPQVAALTEAIVTLGAQLMEQIEQIKATLIRIQESQATEAQALTAQVTTIAQEVSQWTAEGVTTEQLANLQTALDGIAQASEQHAAQIVANTQQISGIVPDEPPPA